MHNPARVSAQAMRFPVLGILKDGREVGHHQAQCFLRQDVVYADTHGCKVLSKAWQKTSKPVEAVMCSGRVSIKSKSTMQARGVETVMI